MGNNKVKVRKRKQKLKSWCYYFFCSILIMFCCIRNDYDTVGIISMFAAVGCLIMIIINAILLLLKK